MKEISEIELRLLDCVHSSIHEAVKTKLSGYGSPLDKVIESVIAKSSPKIQDILDNAVNKALDCVQFKNNLNEAINHKLTKVLISKLEGETEKKVHELRANPVFRAKLTVAIEKVISEL